MSKIKLLTIEKYQSLDSFGDFEAIRIDFSLADKDPKVSEFKSYVIIKLSGTLSFLWQEEHPELQSWERRMEVLVYYLKQLIREKVSKGEKLEFDKEINLSSYDNFDLPDLNSFQINLGQPEEILVEQKFGFKTDN